MKTKKYLVVGIIGMIGFFRGSPILFSQEVRIEPSPFFQEIGTNEKPLSPQDLIILALKASGVPPEKIPFYQNTLETQIQKMKNEMPPFLSDLRQGEWLLRYLHKNFLKTYRADKTLLTDILDQGFYNCVSSTVLYMIAGKTLGLRIEGVETKTHVFARFMSAEHNGHSIDVETTVIYGFHPGAKKKSLESFSRRTGFIYVPPGNYKQRKQLNQKETVGLILHNRIYFLQQAGDYAKALTPAADYASLIGGKEGNKILSDSLLNRLIDLEKKKNYPQAFRLLTRFQEVYGNSSPINNDISALFNNWIVTLLRQQKYEKAKKVSEFHIFRDNTNPEVYNRLRRNIALERVKKEIDKQNFDRAFQIVKQGYQDSVLTKVDVHFVYLKKALFLSKEEGNLKAYWYLDHFYFLDNDPEVRKLKKVLRHNYAVNRHNRFIDLFNRKNYREGLAFIQESLREMLEQTILQEDRELVLSRLED